MNRFWSWKHKLWRGVALVGVLGGVSSAPGRAEEADGGWTLGALLERVARENPDARIAGARLRMADAQVARARAALFPALSVESGYGLTNNPPGAFLSLLNQRQLSFDQDFNDPEVTDNLSGEMRIDYPVYTGGARDAAMRAGRFGMAAARQDSLAVQRRLELEVTRGYLQLHQASELVQIAAAERESLGVSLEVARNRVAAETALETAVLDLEVRLAEAETQLVEAENVRAVRETYLATLMGVEQPSGFRISTAALALQAPGESAQGVRHDLEAAAQRRLQAGAETGVARAGSRPKVHAFTSARRDEGIRESGGGDSWAAGISLQWNLWDGGKARAELAEAQAREEEASEMERKRRLAIAFEIAQARLGCNAARKRIDHSGKAVEQAARSRDITRARFSEGLALASEVIDSERALTQSQAVLARSRAEEQIAIAQWRHALGLPVTNRKLP